MTMTSQFPSLRHCQIFWHCFVSLVKFNYWYKVHIHIITDSGFMAISFYKGLSRNREIGNTPFWVFPNIWRLGWIRNIKFGTSVSNKKKKKKKIIIIIMIMIIKIIITIIINLFLCSVLIHMQRFTLRRGSPNILNLDFNVQSDIFNCCFYARTSVSSYMDNLW